MPKNETGGALREGGVNISGRALKGVPGARRPRSCDQCRVNSDRWRGRCQQAAAPPNAGSSLGGAIHLHQLGERAALELFHNVRLVYLDGARTDAQSGGDLAVRMTRCESQIPHCEPPSSCNGGAPGTYRGGAGSPGWPSQNARRGRAKPGRRRRRPRATGQFIELHPLGSARLPAWQLPGAVRDRHAARQPRGLPAARELGSSYRPRTGVTG